MLILPYRHISKLVRSRIQSQSNLKYLQTASLSTQKYLHLRSYTRAFSVISMYNQRPAAPTRMEFCAPARMDFCQPRMDFCTPASFSRPRMDFCSPLEFGARAEFCGPARSALSDPFPYAMQTGDSEYETPPVRVHCGELRERHSGMLVEISGRVYKQRLGRFLTLRDTNGMTQLVVPIDKQYLIKRVTNIPLDSYIVVCGIVSKRPKNQKNTFMTTGSIEVLINKILNVQINRGYKSVKNMNIMQVRCLNTMIHAKTITSEEFKKCLTSAMSKKFLKRTHNCGELSAIHKGETVLLCGWIESKFGKFIQLRDGYGLVQMVVDASNTMLIQKVFNISLETVVEVRGTVHMRPEAQKNLTMSTGEIEVHVQELEAIDKDSPCDEDNIQVDLTPAILNVNSFTTRTYNCNQIRKENVGEQVTLCGWMSYQRVGKFIILRDGYGQTQLIIPDEQKVMQAMVDNLPLETVLQVEGVVTSRPPGSEQLSMPTGDVEVVLKKITVLNKASNALPFNVREYNKAKEPLRLQHRYLDLRYAIMQKNMRLRSRLLMEMRSFLINQCDFVEVETPTLFRGTPGGAQEFIVPTRIPGLCYSLVQSPQQFKQMLMAGAMDRYFQIARCYRDEATRSDRQPEFTQLDIEMSFTTAQNIMKLTENLIRDVCLKCLPPFTIHFPRMTYAEAMEKYGSDKPDLRIKQELMNCSRIFKPKPVSMEKLNSSNPGSPNQKELENGMEISSKNSDEISSKNAEEISSQIDDLIEDFGAYTLIFKKPLNDFPKSLSNKFDEKAKQFPRLKLVSKKIMDDADFITLITKLADANVAQSMAEFLQIEPECVLFLAYGNRTDAQSLLGSLRVNYVEYLEEKAHIIRDKEAFLFCWIYDFPLFEKDTSGKLQTVHHPFTAPHPDDAHLVAINPLAVRGLAYDLVLNGNEVGGGSIRIHNMEEQIDILRRLNIDHSSLTHLLNALNSGCPPHGGIALGLDRLIATLLRCNSIRDVIAFPKGLEGKDPLSGAPVSISEEDLKTYHLSVNSSS